MHESSAGQFGNKIPWVSLQPCHPECAVSGLISEAEQDWAWVVLGCETT